MSGTEGEVDHCRIGSLETQNVDPETGEIDHCRIGSLEIISVDDTLTFIDHCRIGSLEKEDGPEACP